MKFQNNQASMGVIENISAAMPGGSMGTRYAFTIFP
jgi:hypothetical protein